MAKPKNPNHMGHFQLECGHLRLLKNDEGQAKMASGIRVTCKRCLTLQVIVKADDGRHGL